jgi:hypothetical protein
MSSNEYMRVTHKISNQSGEHHGHMIFCPGCKQAHVFDSRWTFNGDLDKPTFRASMLVNASQPEKRCHSFVTDGEIQFLDDCYHELKGKTVKLEVF